VLERCGEVVGQPGGVGAERWKGRHPEGRAVAS